MSGCARFGRPPWPRRGKSAVFAVYLCLTVLGTAVLATIVAFAQVVAALRPRRTSRAARPARLRGGSDDLTARRKARAAAQAPTTRPRRAATSTATQRSTPSRW